MFLWWIVSTLIWDLVKRWIWNRSIHKMTDWNYWFSHFETMSRTKAWRTEIKVVNDSQNWMMAFNISYIRKARLDSVLNSAISFLTFIHITKYHDLTKYKCKSVAPTRFVAVIVGDIPHSDGHILADDGMPACHIAFKHPNVVNRKDAALFVTFAISNTYIFSRPVIWMSKHNFKWSCHIIIRVEQPVGRWWWI